MSITNWSARTRKRPHRTPGVSRAASSSDRQGFTFSPRPNGQLFVGPNEMAIQDKTDYTSHKTPPGMFVEALQKFLPALEEAAIWSGPTLNPSPCHDRSGAQESDFIIAVDRRTRHSSI